MLYSVTCKVHVVQLAPVPKGGAFIMASNHISHFDPRSSVAFSTAHRLARHGGALCLPLTSRIFTWLNCIPVDRGGATEKLSVRRLPAFPRSASSHLPEGGIRAGDFSILNGAP